jgi:hypothetical protein
MALSGAKNSGPGAQVPAPLAPAVGHNRAGLRGWRIYKVGGSVK